MGSPRIERSYSLHIANAFVEAYRQHHPQDSVTILNLFMTGLPAFDGPIINTKYAIMHGQPATEEEKISWQAIERIIEEFKSVDKYVFAVPMWNFGIPYRLKQYIDILVQPTYTFRVDPEKGYVGLVTGKKALIVYASGGQYTTPPGQAIDYQSRYMQAILKFIGIENIHELTMDDTLGPDRNDTVRRRDGLTEQARQLAKDF
jgi:FMN-dependent NADH-azoreductase